MDNVVRAMAMAELWFGAGRGMENFFCVGLGYGIGSSIVIENRFIPAVLAPAVNSAT